MKKSISRIQRYPKDFFLPVALRHLTDHKTLLLNERYIKELGLTDAQTGQLINGEKCLLASPLTSVYAGHQFGHKIEQLGDRNAHLVGETLNSQGVTHELEVKNSGGDPNSKTEDSLAVLGSSVREYFASEHLSALGISSSRALGIAKNTRPVGDKKIETAARVLRSAPSFLRFGHFEWPVNQNKPELSQKLFDFVLEEFYPQYQDRPRKVALVLSEICKSTASLMAQWMAFGFCHGIMDTDNMSLHGLTINHGPFAFMEDFDLDMTSNPKDHEGRYSYQNQPLMAHWNIKILAGCLQTLESAKGLDLANISNQFVEQFNVLHRILMLKKLGITASRNHQEQLKLIQESVKLLQLSKFDYTFFWRSLSAYDGDIKAHADRLEVTADPAFEEFFSLYDYHLKLEGNSSRLEQMNKINPYLVLKNHFAQDIIEAAQDDDKSFLKGAFSVLTNPFCENKDWSSYAAAAPRVKKDK